MRTLKFNVDRQIISKDPECDFSGLVSGTSKYLKAAFDFSEEWDGCRKAAVFSNIINEKIAVPIINNSCEIPSDILIFKKFRVSVVGAKDDGYYITSNKIEVRQNG